MVISATIASLLCGAPSIDLNRIDTIVRSYVNSRHFSGSVLVARDEKVLFDRAYGMANWDLKVPNKSTTKFRLGSVTKQFTAAAILRLEEQGKLKIEDKVSSVIAEAPASWKDITIRHLLHHESGIPDILGLKDYPTFKQKSHSRDELLKRFLELPLRFEPGTSHRYSNSGYILLGMIIERVSGVSYESFLQQHIFDPAGMKDTGCDHNLKVIPNRATGYVMTKTGLDPAPYIDMSIPLGAGVMYSTTVDLWKWQRAFFGGKVLTSGSMAKMLQPLDGIRPSEIGIGMGLVIDDFYGHRQIFFGGGIEGFNSVLMFDPVDKTVIVALSNVNTAFIDPMCGQISAVSRGEKVTLISERQEIQLSETALKEFVGAYAINEKLSMNIGLAEGKLYVQVDGQDKFVLFAEGKNRFFMRDLDAQAEFVREKDGRLTLLWTQGGGTSRFPARAGI
jgi:CubicO group peptidase (beta-lactamase class C family)